MTFEPKTLDEAKELIREMFDNGAIGTAGHQHWNGADWYQCVSCYAAKDTMGHCSLSDSHTAVDHSPNCKQDALYKWAMSE